jgi:hypothetical protein
MPCSLFEEVVEQVTRHFCEQSSRNYRQKKSCNRIEMGLESSMTTLCVACLE